MNSTLHMSFEVPMNIHMMLSEQQATPNGFRKGSGSGVTAARDEVTQLKWMN